MKSLSEQDFVTLYGPLPSCQAYHPNDVYTSGFDLAALLCLARNSTSILEIGTARGQTTLALAKFCPQAKVVTMDVPAGLIPSGTFQECDLRPFAEVGAAFYGTDEASRITQVWSDPWEPYNIKALQKFGPFDFVWIDGLHSYAGVVKDTEAAVALLADDKEVTVVWDDHLSEGPAILLPEIDNRVPLIHAEGSRLTFFRGRRHDLLAWR